LDVRTELNDLLKKTRTDLIVDYEAQLTALKKELSDANILVKKYKTEKESTMNKMKAEYKAMKTKLEESLLVLTKEFETMRDKHAHIQDRLDASILENSKLHYSVDQFKTLLERSESERAELYQKMVNMEEQLRTEHESKFKVRYLSNALQAGSSACTRSVGDRHATCSR
jgi:chromosome segregation ATPase